MYLIIRFNWEASAQVPICNNIICLRALSCAITILFNALSFVAPPPDELIRFWMCCVSDTRVKYASALLKKNIYFFKLVYLCVSIASSHIITVHLKSIKRPARAFIRDDVRWFAARVEKNFGRAHPLGIGERFASHI